MATLTVPFKTVQQSNAFQDFTNHYTSIDAEPNEHNPTATDLYYHDGLTDEVELQQWLHDYAKDYKAINNQ